MQILLANAKIMNAKASCEPSSEPLFRETADALAKELAQLDIPQLEEMFGCSHKIASENWLRYQNFFTAQKLPAILAYNGQAYKHLKASTLSEAALAFGQHHLWITSFLYGILRPLDAVVPYRLEKPGAKPKSIFELSAQRKAALTDALIASVKADDGVLIHLSTEEYEHLFDWKRVRESVKVIQPLFYVKNPKGDLKVQAVWAKSCRGAMVRFILENQLSSPEALTAFDYEGFSFAPNYGEEAFPHFIRR